eukprot:Phypoly_transcript_04683.p2 GENE.Phypoly_transcript_04683~~Phypoly_transcript_04683.p2  ORF type:complete len:171 (+),score=32.86 Phypoly_transcript_04683:896-1408(+)
MFEYVKVICKLMEPEYNFILSYTEYAVDNTPCTQPIFSPLDRNIFNYPHITTSLYTLNYGTPSPPTDSSSSTNSSNNSPASTLTITPEASKPVDNPYSVAPIYSDSYIPPDNTSSTTTTNYNHNYKYNNNNTTTYTLNTPSGNTTDNNCPPPIPQMYTLNNMNFDAGGNG